MVATGGTAADAGVGLETVGATKDSPKRLIGSSDSGSSGKSWSVSVSGAVRTGSLNKFTGDSSALLAAGVCRFGALVAGTGSANNVPGLRTQKSPTVALECRPRQVQTARSPFPLLLRQQVMRNATLFASSLEPAVLHETPSPVAISYSSSSSWYTGGRTCS